MVFEQKQKNICFGDIFLILFLTLTGLPTLSGRFT
jgi:hypothetical protein